MSGHVIVIAGPTASGKTALGIYLAKALGGEIVSADSMQIYRGMDIGTAKATAEERSAVPHHMIDIVSPLQDYSVADYVQDASRVCDALISAGKTPVIVGGTGLYIDSLISGRTFDPDSRTPEVRRELEAEFDSLGGEEMLKRLSGFDPDRAALLHPADRKRIIRAFEVYRLTGRTITEHDELTRALPPRYEAVYIIPSFKNRQTLYDRINSRVDAMIDAGLFDEVRSLLDRGVPEGSTAMQAIGYKEAVQALSGEITGAEAIESIKLASRRYAKRQLTWFGRHGDAVRLYYEDFPSAEELYSSPLSIIKGERNEHFG